MVNDIKQQILQKFDQESSLFFGFTKKLETLLTELLENTGIEVHVIKSRLNHFALKVQSG